MEVRMKCPCCGAEFVIPEGHPRYNEIKLEQLGQLQLEAHPEIGEGAESEEEVQQSKGWCAGDFSKNQKKGDPR